MHSLECVTGFHVSANILHSFLDFSTIRGYNILCTKNLCLSDEDKYIMASQEHLEVRFSEILRSLLKTHGLTQRDLADYLGLKAQTVSLYCMGKSYPEFATLIKIARYFGVSLDYLITGKNKASETITADLGLPSNVIDLLMLVKNGEFNRGVNLSAVLYLLLENRDFLNMLYMASFILKEGYRENMKIESLKDKISELNDKDISAESIKYSVASERLNSIKSIVSKFFYRFFTQNVYYEDLTVPDNISASDLSAIDEIFWSLGYRYEKGFKNVLNKINRPCHD